MVLTSFCENNKMVGKEGIMKNSKKLYGIMILMVCIMPFFTSCATIMGGGGKSPSERSAEIRWGYFILDLFTTGGIGLIIDFSNGAIYKSKTGKYSSLHKEMIEAINKGAPAYIVKNDGIYRVTLSSDNKTELMTKIPKEQLPPKVIDSLNLALAH